MITEDDEFNRIEREASLRKAAVHATVTKKEWVSLTAAQIDEAWRSVDYKVPYEQFRIDVSRAIENKSKELNA